MTPNIILIYISILLISCSAKNSPKSIAENLCEINSVMLNEQLQLADQSSFDSLKHLNRLIFNNNPYDSIQFYINRSLNLIGVLKIRFKDSGSYVYKVNLDTVQITNALNKMKDNIIQHNGGIFEYKYSTSKSQFILSTYERRKDKYSDNFNFVVTIYISNEHKQTIFELQSKSNIINNKVIESMSSPDSFVKCE